MTLRDRHGEITVNFADLFRCQTGKPEALQSATVSVLFPESRLSTAVAPVICCRVLSGSVEVDGETHGPGDLLLFTGEAVAAGVRAYRSPVRSLLDYNQGVSIHPEHGAAPNVPRARLSKPSAQQNQPSAQESLFD